MHAETRKQIERMMASTHGDPIAHKQSDGSSMFIDRPYFICKDGLKVSYSCVRVLLGKGEKLPTRVALERTGVLEDFEQGVTVSIVPLSI